MTAIVVTSGPEPAADPTLVDAITTEFSTLIAWDPEQRRIEFPREHPMLGWNACIVVSCGKATTSARALCHACAELWRRAGQPDLVEFAATTGRKRRRLRRRNCSVPGCERPQENKGTYLCLSHHNQYNYLGLPLDEFRADERVRPYSRLGVCAVVACDWDRYAKGSYCRIHANRRTEANKSDPNFDDNAWQRVAPPIDENDRVCLLGLPETLVAELLYGLQTRTNDGIRTHFSTMRLLVDRIRGAEIDTLRDLPDQGLSVNHTRPLRNYFIKALDRRRNDPVTNFASDHWNLAVTGHKGTLHFDAINQSWLREATKRWVLDELPKRKGPRTDNVVKGYIGDIARFSASLARHRRDDGDDPRALSRDDVVEFLNWLAYLEDTGEITYSTRQRICSYVDTVLRRMRGMRLARPGGPLEGLPDEVALERGDIPTSRRNGTGRDLPASVVEALVAALPELEAQAGREVRTAVELLMDTGRRPSEITSLPLGCLGHDPDQTPVLIWDNVKAERYGRRLPISALTAELIVAQQERVRARYPGIADDELVLLPRAKRNPRGNHPITHSWAGTKHRGWIDSLPALIAPTQVQIDGHTVTRTVPFPRNTIQLYCWRHTYAQRHADAGVAVDVLADLLDHTKLSTTQRYYRVSKTRQRAAVDRVTSMQFNRHGQRLWRETETLLDSERTRRGVGEVAVPYGGCTEPSNVAAGGGDCPVRYRCVGCNHFRTDVSYLPDLEAYQADLLRNRERLLATSADAWAIDEAMPSEQEITRMRTLIGRVKADLDDLDDAERTEIENAVTAVRRARQHAVSLGLPTVRPKVPGLREEHTA